MTSHSYRPPGFARFLKWMGVLLISLGVFGSFLTVFVASFFFRVPPDEAWPGWLEPIVRGLLIALGAFLLYRGKQYAARARALRTLEDERPPVVYLRPFAQDERMSVPIVEALYLPTLITGLFSTEEQLAEAVAPLGPLIAIGQPGEHLPTPGAARAYASDAEWKDVVDHWLSNARLVIIRPGISEGVWWEMERIFTTVRPERVLVLLLWLNRAGYESFAESVQARFGIALPRFKATGRYRLASGFLEFSDGWKARFLPLRVPFWRQSPYKLMRRMFHQALQPVFLRFGIDWRPLRISILLVLFLVGFLVWTLGRFADGLVRVQQEVDARSAAVLNQLNEAPPAIPALEWRSSSVAGLQLSAPGTFELVRGREFQELRESQQAIQELEYYRLETGTVSVDVVRFTFKPGTQLQLDGALQGELNALGQEEGVRDVRHSTLETEVSGHRALRASVWFTQGHQNIRFERLAFNMGQTLWMVYAIKPDAPDAEETLERILDSVRLVESRF